MGTEVLRPQDCLIERIRVSPAVSSQRRGYGNYCNYYNNHAASSRSSRKPDTRPEKQDQRKRPGAGSSQPVVAEVSFLKGSSADDSRMGNSTGLTMERVTILRRGESLDSMLKSEASKKYGNDLVAYGTERLGPNPEMLPKQSRVVESDVYSGSAFAVSPSPSALPLPSFPKKKHSAAVVDDSATRDLRRLLRLE